MFKKILFLFIFVLFFSTNTQAQFGRVYQEVGVMAGPIFFKSDYGERDDFKNFKENVGYSIGFFYYFSFIEDYPGLRENFKLRLDASFTKTNLDHYGKYVDPSKTSLIAQQLRAMKGSTQTVGLGFQVEFFPWKTDDYNRDALFSPFVSLGGQLGNYTSRVYSELESSGNPFSAIEKFSTGIRNESNFVASLTGSLGTRFKLDPYNSLMLDCRLQYYTSDWVDGLNPDRRKYPENKANDYSLTFNFGYIYYFN